jgi:hypothetical protein
MTLATALSPMCSHRDSAKTTFWPFGKVDSIEVEGTPTTNVRAAAFAAAAAQAPVV